MRSRKLQPGDVVRVVVPENSDDMYIDPVFRSNWDGLVAQVLHECEHRVLQLGKNSIVLRPLEPRRDHVARYAPYHQFNWDADNLVILPKKEARQWILAYELQS